MANTLEFQPTCGFSKMNVFLNQNAVFCSGVDIIAKYFCNGMNFLKFLCLKNIWEGKLGNCFTAWQFQTEFDQENH